MADKKPENPWAFPHSPAESQHGHNLSYGEYGMSLRDYFAASAMHAVIRESCAKPEATWEDCMEATATLSYLIADAMLKARES